MNEFWQKIETDRRRRAAVLGGVLLLLALFLCSLMYVAYATEGNFLQGSDEKGADLYYHANRILSIAEGWKGGSFWVKVYPDALNGYGYASPLFYPDLFLFLPAFLVFLGMPLPLAYSIFCTLIFFCSGVFYYLFGRKVFAHTGYALFSGALFMTGHFTFVTIVYMGGIGQALAAVFAPLLLLGIYNMLREGFSKPWILLCAMLGFTFSHTISLFLYGLFLIVVVLCHAKTLFLNRTWWIKVGLIFGAYLCLTACYFLPFLEQMLSAEFLQSISWAKLSDYAYYADAGKHMFFYGNPFTRSGTVRYTIGILAVAGMGLRVFVKTTAENRMRVKWINRLIVIVTALMLCCTRLFPWQLLEHTIFSAIQFPFRILMIAAMLLPLCHTLILRELFAGNCRVLQLPRRALAVLAAAAVAVCAVYDVVFLPDGRTLANDSAAIHAYVGTGEWLPIYETIEDISSYRALIEDDNIYASDGSAVAYTRAEHTVTITFSAEAEEYSLPLIYYKGYAAYVETESGRIPLAVTANADARVTVEVPAAGEVTVYYAGTVVQTASAAVSGAALVLCLGYGVFVWPRRRAKIDGEKDEKSKRIKR